MAATPERFIYLDHHSTTPVDLRVVERIVHVMTEAYGNPANGAHLLGEEAGELIRSARKDVAALVRCDAEEVAFVPSATAACRAALADAFSRAPGRPLRVLSTPVEHSAVLDPLQQAQRGEQADVRWLRVDTCGRLDLEYFADELAHGADLVCAMAANNEIGTIFPTRQIAEMAAAAGAEILVDATQAAGKILIDVSGQGISCLALSAHKMYGPKGIGALIINPTAGRAIEAAGGTLNVPGIVGFGEACRLRRLEMSDDEPRIATLRDRLEERLLQEVPGLIVNGDRSNRLAGNLHVSFPDIPADPVIARLGRRLALSTGSACRSGSDAPSHVLQAIGLSGALCDGALRIGLGRSNTQEEIDLAAEMIAVATQEVRVALQPHRPRRPPAASIGPRRSRNG